MSISQMHRRSTPVELASDNIYFDMVRLRSASTGILTTDQVKALRAKAKQLRARINEYEQAIRDTLNGY